MIALCDPLHFFYFILQNTDTCQFSILYNSHLYRISFAAFKFTKRVQFNSLNSHINMRAALHYSFWFLKFWILSLKYNYKNNIRHSVNHASSLNSQFMTTVTSQRGIFPRQKCVATTFYQTYPFAYSVPIPVFSYFLTITPDCLVRVVTWHRHDRYTVQ